jgi:DNA-binding response OmpR family regulator
MLQRDEVCTREELLSEVWGYSFDPGTNIVDVCVLRLGAKIGAERIDDSQRRICVPSFPARIRFRTA